MVAGQSAHVSFRFGPDGSPSVPDRRRDPVAPVDPPARPIRRIMSDTAIYCRESDKELIYECHESIWDDPDAMPYRLTLRRLAEDRLESERTAVLSD